MKPWLPTALALAALVAPIAWAVNMQLGEMLPYVDCVSRVQSLVIWSAVFVVLGIGSAAGSVAALRATSRSTLRFLAGLGAGSAGLFSFALALQLAAALVISPCQR
jgi:hypothetical protein